MRVDWKAKRIVYPKIKWHGYFLSFFWLLDVVVILSMFPDVPQVAESMRLDNYDTTSFTYIGRTIRLVRLFRILRAYRILFDRSIQRKRELEVLNMMRFGAVDFEEELKKLATYTQRTSKLGAQLSSSTTNRVVVLILLLLLVIPLLLYSPPNNLNSFSLDFVQSVNTNPNLPTFIKDSLVTTIAHEFNGLNAELVFMQVSPLYNATLVNDASTISNLWPVSLLAQQVSSVINGTTYFTSLEISQEAMLRQTAGYNIALTIFIGVVLVLGNIVFTLDTQNLVLKPIERMMKMVEAVAKDPLSNFRFDHDAGFGSYETNLLEKTFVKIAGLLRVGFGEAGAGIIKSNLSFGQGSTNSAIINPLLPGVRVFCIVGFCDIHQFEYCTQQLERDVFTFVNTIAHIVHESVHYWEGSCNKNLGNAFVIIWRIGDEQTLLAQMAKSMSMSSTKLRRRSNESEVENDSTPSSPMVRSNSMKRNSTDAAQQAAANARQAQTEKKQNKYQQIDLKRLPGVDQLAAKALIAYLKIIAEINKSPQILAYRKDKRLTNNGRANFKVQMGFGLHAGWAIEGAVGSLEKVDATYLSPHVNMAARLETSSRQYQVPLLASQNFYELLSPYIQKYCRRLDVVTVKGSEMPIGIYTYDCLQDQSFRGRDFRGSGGRRASDKVLGGQVPDTVKPESVKGPSESSRPNVRFQSKEREEESDPQINMDTQDIGASSPSTKGDRRHGLVKRGVPAQKKSLHTTIFATNEDEPEEVFEKDSDLITLRKHITEEFTETFLKGVNAYLSGDWPLARRLLEESDALMRVAVPEGTGDGPSQTLLSYMSIHGFCSPMIWEGFRPLTSK